MFNVFFKTRYFGRTRLPSRLWGAAKRRVDEAFVKVDDEKMICLTKRTHKDVNMSTNIACWLVASVGPCGSNRNATKACFSDFRKWLGKFPGEFAKSKTSSNEMCLESSGLAFFRWGICAFLPSRSSNSLLELKDYLFYLGGCQVQLLAQLFPSVSNSFNGNL